MTATPTIVISPRGATHHGDSTRTRCGVSVSFRWGWSPARSGTYVTCRRCQRSGAAAPLVNVLA